jgi:peroxiredoxin
MAWRKEPEMLAAGVRAPEVSFRTLDGRSQTLADLLAGGPVVLAFFKVTCPVCQMALPYLDRLHRGAVRDGAAMQFIGVSQDDAAAAREFASEFNITFPVLLDEASRGYTASNAFAIHSVPSVFLIEPDGRVSASGHGFSKKDIEALGRRAGVAPFEPAERVPDFRPG